MVTDQQVRLLKQKRMEGKSQKTAAAAAGTSVRRAWSKVSGLDSPTNPDDLELVSFLGIQWCARYGSPVGSAGSMRQATSRTASSC
jgi:hypothetical protein